MAAGDRRMDERARALSLFAFDYPDGGVTVAYQHETRAEGLHTDIRTLRHLRVYARNGEHYVAGDDDLHGGRRTFLLRKMKVICSYPDMAKVSNGH